MADRPVPDLRIYSADEPGRHNGMPVQLVHHADWRGGRLYLDGAPFPFATHAPPQVMDVQPNPGQTRAINWHVLYVPVVVDGDVDLTGRPDPQASADHPERATFGPLH